MSKVVLQHMQRKSGLHAAPSFTLVRSGLLQRKCACGGTPGPTGECEACKKKRSGLQTKLAVNEPGDIYEQEADRIADQVMAAPAHSVVNGTPPRIQRFSGHSSGQMDAAPASVDRVLASPGRPLEPALRRDMGQRFGHDFASVRVYADAAAEQSARDVNAHAYTVGQAIVFGSGRFAPGTHDGRRLIAHELTHVVQQSAADGTRIGNEKRGMTNLLSSSNSLYPSRRSDAHVQRFTEPGHKLLGDKAFGTELLTLGGVRMTFGEAVAMADYFGSFKYMRKLAESKEPGKGRDTKAVVLYVLWVKIRKHNEKTKLKGLSKEDPELIAGVLSKNKEAEVHDLYNEKAAFQADQISRHLDSQNISHFPNPLTGDTALDPNQKNQRVIGAGKDKKPLGAAATYREAHEMAMLMAYINGTHQQSNDDALLADGFACHFLTDSFSASHLRTPRASIKEYWDKKVPGFREKLIQWLADQINQQPLLLWGHDLPYINMLERLGAIVSPYGAPNSTVRTAVVTQFSILLSGGDFSFGDVVSLIVHEAEGAATVDASIDGNPLTLVGDKDLVDEKPIDALDPDGEKAYSLKQAGAADQTAKAAIAAVKASLEDIYDAYAAGLPEDLGTIGLGYAGFGSFQRTFHHKDFNTLKKDAQGRRALYRAEQLIPTAVEDKYLPPDKKTLPWMQASVDDLLSTNNSRIGKALELFGKGISKEFTDRLKYMKDLKPEHRALIEKVLIAPLASGDANRIRKLLKSIIVGAGTNLYVGPQGVSETIPDDYFRVRRMIFKDWTR